MEGRAEEGWGDEEREGEGRWEGGPRLEERMKRREEGNGEKVQSGYAIWVF